MKEEEPQRPPVRGQWMEVPTITNAQKTPPEPHHNGQLAQTTHDVDEMEDMDVETPDDEEEMQQAQVPESAPVAGKIEPESVVKVEVEEQTVRL